MPGNLRSCLARDRPDPSHQARTACPPASRRPPRAPTRPGAHPALVTLAPPSPAPRGDLPPLLERDHRGRHHVSTNERQRSRSTAAVSVPLRAAHSPRSAPRLRRAPNRRRAHIRPRAGRQPAKTRRMPVRPRGRRIAMRVPWANLDKPGPHGQSVKPALSVSHARPTCGSGPPGDATLAAGSAKESSGRPDDQTCPVDGSPADRLVARQRRHHAGTAAWRAVHRQ